MKNYQKNVRKLIGKTFKDRTVLDVVYKSGFSNGKFRADWYFICKCFKHHESCLRKVDLMESACGICDTR